MIVVNGNYYLNEAIGKILITNEHMTYDIMDK